MVRGVIETLRCADASSRWLVLTGLSLLCSACWHAEGVRSTRYVIRDSIAGGASSDVASRLDSAEYLSYPSLIAIPQVRGGTEALRPLLDSLSLVDVSESYLSNGVLHDQMILSKKDRSAFDRRNSSELATLRSRSIMAGPIISLTERAVAVSSNTLWVKFSDRLPREECERRLSALGARSLQRADNLYNAYTATFDPAMGEAIHDLSREIVNMGDVDLLYVVIWEPAEPMLNPR